MAKAKKAKKKSVTRRRRVGATRSALNPNSPLVLAGAAALGFFAAPFIQPKIDNLTGTMDGKIIGAVEGGLGAALVFMTKKKSLLSVGAGGLLLGMGAKKLLQEFGVINGIGGYQAVPVIGQRMLNGYGKVPVLGAYATSRQQMNGVFNGYNVPPVPKSQVMGSTAGSGYSSASGYME